ncbi:MAG: hypothetical protein K1W14_06690 [Muribaculaceae bacterium]
MSTVDLLLRHCFAWISSSAAMSTLSAACTTDRMAKEKYCVTESSGYAFAISFVNSDRAFCRFFRPASIIRSSK